MVEYRTVELRCLRLFLVCSVRANVSYHFILLKCVLSNSIDASQCRFSVVNINDAADEIASYSFSP
jgi:hypothetical protein